jgi:hypothetical protein
MSVASFKVRGRLDSAGGEMEGTIMIDRETGKVSVRPKGRRSTYDTSLSQVATWVCQNAMGLKVSG